jgi:tRNA uridine 5-carboxymethylaminomethyl modification enzyme
MIESIPSVAQTIHSISADPEIIEQVEIKAKYNGYILKEMDAASKIRKFESIQLLPDFNYASLPSLSLEARQKLAEIKPASIGQAARISGVSPSDISVLLVHLGK